MSPHFAGRSRIDRQRLVYKAAGDLLVTDIHALSITALASGRARGILEARPQADGALTRAMPSRISRCATSASSQPSTFTHLLGSRSL